MTLEPFLETSLAIQLHIIGAVFGIVFGGVQLVLAKGTKRHKYAGYIWVMALAFVAVSGFFIHEIRLWGAFSPIHLLSLLTLFFLYSAMKAVRNKQINRHRVIMINIYVFALLLTGAFTFWPGRIMYNIFFGL